MLTRIVLWNRSYQNSKLALPDLDFLKDVLHRAKISNRDRVLILLGQDNNEPKTTTELRSIALQAGAARGLTDNLTSYLSKAKGLAIKVAGKRGEKSRWELHSNGKKHLESRGFLNVRGTTAPLLTQLQILIAPNPNVKIKKFVLESVACVENHLFRAGIVLSWVGALAVLYEWVVKNRLSDFNSAASARFKADWKKASNEGGLANMKESNFLLILSDIQAIDKGTKTALEACLNLRNGCGHPNGLVVGEHAAAAHVETLINNVFLRF